MPYSSFEKNLLYPPSLDECQCSEKISLQESADLICNFHPRPLPYIYFRCLETIVTRFRLVTRMPIPGGACRVNHIRYYNIPLD